MKNNHILLLSIALLCYSCSDNTKGDILSKFNKTEDIYNVPIKLKHDSIFHQVWGLLCYDDILIAYDVDNRHYFSITDLKTNTMLSKVVKRGQGPNEIAGFPISLSFINEHTFSILDPDKSILFTIDFKDTYNPIIQEKLRLSRDDGFIMALIPLHSDLYIATGFFKDGRYLLFDKDKNEISFDLDYPKFSNEKMFTNAHKAMAFQGQLMSKPDGKRFYFAGSHSEVFEIVEVTDDKKLNKVFEFHGEIGNYKPEGDGVKSVASAISRHSKYKFVSSACTQNYIYLLFSNRVIGENASVANTVLVFDWDGKPIKILNLDTDVTQIAVNENDNIMYAIDPNSDTYLVKFNM